MSCPECESSKTRRWHGVFEFRCLGCCARLVLSARPSKPHGAAQLGAIEHFLRWNPDVPFTTQDVLSEVKRQASNEVDRLDGPAD